MISFLTSFLSLFCRLNSFLKSLLFSHTHFFKLSPRLQESAFLAFFATAEATKIKQTSKHNCSYVLFIRKRNRWKKYPQVLSSFEECALNISLKFLVTSLSPDFLKTFRFIEKHTCTHTHARAFQIYPSRVHTRATVASLSASIYPHAFLYFAKRNMRARRWKKNV